MDHKKKQTHKIWILLAESFSYVVSAFLFICSSSGSFGTYVCVRQLGGQSSCTPFPHRHPYGDLEDRVTG